MPSARKLRAARRFHMYLACFFAPMLLFYSLTGGAQLFMLHVDEKVGYQAPAALEALGNIHTHQQMGSESSPRAASAPFRYLSLAMAAGLVATLALGMVLAGAMASANTAWRLFLAGSLVPIVALWLGSLATAPT